MAVVTAEFEVRFLGEGGAQARQIGTPAWFWVTEVTANVWLECGKAWLADPSGDRI